METVTAGSIPGVMLPKSMELYQRWIWLLVFSFDLFRRLLCRSETIKYSQRYLKNIEKAKLECKAPFPLRKRPDFIEWGWKNWFQVSAKVSFRFPWWTAVPGWPETWTSLHSRTAVWKGPRGLSVHLRISAVLSWMSVPADTLFVCSPKIHVNRLNILMVQVSQNCLEVLCVMMFISRYFWISVDNTDFPHTAVASGRQGIAPRLWSIFSPIPLRFTPLDALTQAKRQQHALQWLTGSSVTEKWPSVLAPSPSHCNGCSFSTEISSHLRKQKQWAMHDGDKGFANMEGDSQKSCVFFSRSWVWKDGGSPERCIRDGVSGGPLPAAELMAAGGCPGTLAWRWCWVGAAGVAPVSVLLPLFLWLLPSLFFHDQVSLALSWASSLLLSSPTKLLPGCV